MAENGRHQPEAAHACCVGAKTSSGAAPKAAAGACCGGHGAAGHDHAHHHDHAGHDHAGHDHAAHAQAHHAPADHGHAAASAPSPARASGKVRDPVCGMTVDPATAKHRFEHAGETYWFCSAGCREKFAADPERWLSAKGTDAGKDGHHGHAHHAHSHGAGGAAKAPADAIYTCPMHPEIRQKGPGECPICGMALEPVTASLDDGPNPELVDMRRRLWIGLALTIPVFVLEMGGHLVGGHLIDPRLSAIIQFVLATPVVLWVGWPFFVRGYRSVVSGNLNMFTLIALGTGVAWGYSVVALLFPGLFPAALGDGHGSVPVYFEAAAVITVLVVLGQVLELSARDRTAGALRALMSLAPKRAVLIGEGGEREVDVAEVAVGDRVRVRPGEAVPVDGTVTEGRASIDESMVTGESMPVSKDVGDTVTGGTMNRAGSLVVRAERVGADTALARIAEAVAKAQRSRAPVQRLADRVAGWFVPLVIAVAALAFAAWMIFGPEPRLAYALVAAVSVLIIACPCALGLATPMSIMVGVGRGAGQGFLVRDAAALERLAEVDTLVVDKTGTLTEGRPAVVAVEPVAPMEEAELLRLAAALERGSAHPLAVAVVAAADERGLGPGRAEDFEELTGRGVTGTVDGRRVAIGGEKLMAEVGADASALAGTADRLRADGTTAILVAIDGRAAGVIGLADRIRDTTPAALAALAEAGVRVVMMTGDAEATAAAIARRLGISEYEAGVAPERKAEVVERLKREGRVVAMAGDGVNDSPALAAADVGVAMGGGAEAAIESAGVTLLRPDLGALAVGRKLSAATMRNIRQNLVFAFAYNALGVPVAAGILYPTFGLLLSPVVAAAAMALSSVSVIANALRLAKVKL